jgi:hypothetical protein
MLDFQEEEFQWGPILEGRKFGAKALKWQGTTD